MNLCISIHILAKSGRVTTIKKILSKSDRCNNVCCNPRNSGGWCRKIVSWSQPGPWCETNNNSTYLTSTKPGITHLGLFSQLLVNMHSLSYFPFDSDLASSVWDSKQAPCWQPDCGALLPMPALRCSLCRQRVCSPAAAAGHTGKLSVRGHEAGGTVPSGRTRVDGLI